MRLRTMHSDDDPQPDPSLEALAARLRALPEPPVPAGLEARLLTAITPRISCREVKRPVARQGWSAVACAVGTVAAVSLFVVLVTRQPEISLISRATPLDSQSVASATVPVDELGGNPLSPVGQ